MAIVAPFLEGLGSFLERGAVGAAKGLWNYGARPAGRGIYNAAASLATAEGRAAAGGRVARVARGASFAGGAAYGTAFSAGVLGTRAARGAYRVLRGSGPAFEKSAGGMYMLNKNIQEKILVGGIAGGAAIGAYQYSTNPRTQIENTGGLPESRQAGDLSATGSLSLASYNRNRG